MPGLRTDHYWTGTPLSLSASSLPLSLGKVLHNNTVIIIILLINTHRDQSTARRDSLGNKNTLTLLPPAN